YIESLGLIGKGAVRKGLGEWSGEVRNALRARGRREDGAGAAGAPDAGGRGAGGRGPAGAVDTTAPAETTPKALDTGESVGDLLARIQDELLAEAADKAEPEHVDPAKLTRYITLSGPPGSGKTHLLEIVTADLLPGGFDVVELGGDYESLVGAGGDERPSRGVDPGSIVVDRYRRGWEWLQTLARPGGVVLEVDGLESLDKEKRDFLEHAINHAELAITDDEEPGIFFVVADASPALGKALCELGAREEAVQAFEIPPPAAGDVEAIVDAFHGRMSGVKERRSLADYIESYLESSGAVMMSLREAVADHRLHYERGRWRFSGTGGGRGKRALSSTRYYEKLLEELPQSGRELLRWLCAHPDVLSPEQLQELSGLDEAALREARESIRPYRVLETVYERGDDRLRFVSAGVRDAFYRCLAEKDRREIHHAFVDYLGGYRDTRMSGLEALGFHFERAGMVREALLRRVKALRIAKNAKDVPSIRRLCEGGITYVRTLDDAKWGEKKWLWERYFIKSCIDAEWIVSNYGGLVELVEACFEERRREVPLSFVYKYGTALERSG
ncbi:MAG: hypothetical protein ACE5EO_13170, partial [Candidatus Krumholzibacteriia bacterium]